VSAADQERLANNCWTLGEQMGVPFARRVTICNAGKVEEGREFVEYGGAEANPERGKARAGDTPLQPTNQGETNCLGGSVESNIRYS